MNNHHVVIAGDIIAGTAMLSWLLGAYETHIGAVVSTMAGIYYLIQFMRWMTRKKD